jgi:hypothetical protein
MLFSKLERFLNMKITCHNNKTKLFLVASAKEPNIFVPLFLVSYNDIYPHYYKRV